MTIIHNNNPVEIEPGKFPNINDNLHRDQQRNLIQVLQKYKGYFALDYPDMKGIDPKLCTHHIYKDARPIQQPQ